MALLDLGPAGLHGILKGPPPSELPPEAWSNGANVRMVNGAVHRQMGAAAVYGTPPIAPYWVLAVPGTQNYFWIYAGAQKVYATDQLTHTNISKNSGAFNYTGVPGAWNGAVLGGIPILTNGVNPPQAWSPPALGTYLTDLANWPTGYRCKVLRAYKRIAIAMDILTDAGVRYPHNVRWSHPADPGTLPSSWSLTDKTKLSGELPLSEHGGFIVDGLSLGNSFIVYKEGAIIALHDVGFPYIFQPRTISSIYGALSKNCVQEIDKTKHVLVTQGDIVVHNGQDPVSILMEKQRSSLFSMIDPTYYTTSFTFIISELKEFVWAFPERGASWPTIAFVWNWGTNTFSFRTMDAYYVGTGIVDPGTGDGVIDSINVLIDDYVKLIDERAYNPTKRALLAARASTAQFLKLEEGWTIAGSAYSSYVERTGLALLGRDRLGNWQADPKVIKMVRAIWPRVKSEKPINVYVGSQEVLNGSVTWSGPKSYDPNSGPAWVDFDVVGPYICTKFEFPHDTEAVLEDYSLDLVPVGRY